MRSISINNDLLRHEQTAYCKSNIIIMQHDGCALSDAKCNSIVLNKYKDISSLNYTQFIQTLEREVRFEDKRSSIYYYTKTADSDTRGQLTTQVRSGVALPPVKRAQLLSQTQESVKKNALRSIRELVQLKHETRRSQEYIRTANARRIVRGLKNSASASLLIYSNYALQEYSLLNVRYVQRPADACNKIGTHRGYSRICSKLSRTATRFLSANMMALIGTVLYNAIKEYYDDRMRKTIYFHSYTVENNYNAICEK
ncbi:hypothetical protein HBH64_218550 [Parastagonospora nodorum]|nr:hypothetical protein HBI02_224940 [Parastagonospora nodorum]KAH4287976.1 hypothetical protein HBI01_227170 [Parastagonospora nodorum]KAH4356109.1 hypothetical protein HBH94_232430 [Parastagonospora nodorum]KAH4443129.1 hypothetical protein HBH90_224740 [Parastagonospora nodorum]KAH4489888.1 hypothetical protein HBH87_223160 [Parastagonospora nodorum]